MLGLGTSTVKGGPAKRLVGTYTSDFTSDADGWAGNSIQGTLTLTANQTIDSTGGWLKGTFDTNQTDDNARLQLSDVGISITPGMSTEISYKIYIVNDSNKWGSTPPIFHRFYYNGGFVSSNVSYDTTTSISDNDTAISTSPIVYFQFGWASLGDGPLAGAVFYIKDIVYNVYSM
tara:strand:+ start:616 stop:1140 length:525 start_codon:yes stop_codon:yes gene_type:complete